MASTVLSPPTGGVNSPPPPLLGHAPGLKLRRLVSKRALHERDDFQILLAAATCLNFNAGFTNVVTMSTALKMTSSHVTGLLARTSISVADAAWPSMYLPITAFLCFLSGSIVGGLSISYDTFYLGRTYNRSILLIAALQGSALLLDKLFLDESQGAHAYIYTCCAAMGLQNSLTSKYSGNTLRTTHATGATTDLGIAIGHLLKGRYEDIWKVKLHGLALTGFLLGGILGRLSYIRFQEMSLLFNVGIMCLLALGHIYILSRMEHVSIWDVIKSRADVKVHVTHHHNVAATAVAPPIRVSPRLHTMSSAKAPSSRVLVLPMSIAEGGEGGGEEGRVIRQQTPPSSLSRQGTSLSRQGSTLQQPQQRPSPVVRTVSVIGVQRSDSIRSGSPRPRKDTAGTGAGADITTTTTTTAPAPPLSARNYSSKASSSNLSSGSGGADTGGSFFSIPSFSPSLQRLSSILQGGSSGNNNGPRGDEENADHTHTHTDILAPPTASGDPHHPYSSSPSSVSFNLLPSSSLRLLHQASSLGGGGGGRLVQMQVEVAVEDGDDYEMANAGDVDTYSVGDIAGEDSDDEGGVIELLRDSIGRLIEVPEEEYGGEGGEGEGEGVGEGAGEGEDDGGLQEQAAVEMDEGRVD